MILSPLQYKSRGIFLSLIAVTAVFSEHTEPILTQTLGAFKLVSPSSMPKLMWIDKEMTKILGRKGRRVSYYNMTCIEE